MLLSDPGYVRYEYTFAESMDQTIFIEPRTDELSIVVRKSIEAINEKMANKFFLFYFKDQYFLVIVS